MRRGTSDRGMSAQEWMMFIIIAIVIVVVWGLISGQVYGAQSAQQEGIWSQMLSMIGIKKQVTVSASCDGVLRSGYISPCTAKAGNVELAVLSPVPDIEKKTMVVQGFTKINGPPIRITFDQAVARDKQGDAPPLVRLRNCPKATNWFGKDRCQYGILTWCDKPGQCVMDDAGTTLVIKQLPSSHGFFEVGFVAANVRPDGTALWSKLTRAFQPLNEKTDVVQFALNPSGSGAASAKDTAVEMGSSSVT